MNCQSTFVFLLFLNFCHAITSFLTTAMSSILLFKHWLVSTFNSISAIFNQLPCFGVYTNSNRSHIAFALFGWNVSYNDPGTCVFRLSITNVIFSAVSYCSAISSKKQAQSCFVLCLVVFTMRIPFNGSQAIKILHTPQRLYS